MLRWPVAAALVLAGLTLLPLAVLSGSPSLSHARWLAAHHRAVQALDQDQRVLARDDPTHRGDPQRWVLDWEKFHADVAAAASLPNPGGTATAPWREMLNDYYNGSAEILQAIRADDPGLLARAQSDIRSGNRAAAEFDQAMGVAP